MCGIAGILGVRDGAVDEPRLLRMRDTMVARGPDGAGVWHDAARRVGLAHRRLSIVDLTAAGAQPMATEDGLLQLVYNGEIYNHLEVRRELEARGHRFRSRCDTEVILRGYREWGEKLLDRLIGMFAFAIWDAASRRLFLARDRIGIKPLYYGEVGGEFLFASEIKALLADPAVPRAIDPTAAYHYLTFLVPPAPLTMFQGIFKLPAGCFMEVTPGGTPRITRWWDPVDAPAAGTDKAAYSDDDAAAGELLSRLDRAIERRMMSDVPFGVFLSGGIDSSTNVALMARHMDRPVSTFTVGFKKYEQLNELPYARLVSDRFATDHHEILIDEKDAENYLPEMVRQQDEPIADWVCVPLYFVSKLAKQSGVTVVQVGEGSDELFCGYPHFIDAVNTYRHYGRPIGALPAPLRRAASAAAHLAAVVHPAWNGRAEAAEAAARGDELFLGGAICFDEREKGELWTGPRPAGGSQAAVREILAPFRAANPDADFYQQMLYLELRQRLPELLLMRVDKITMSTSVEARVPFLDHELVEYAMDLPLHMRVRDGVGKWLLKRAVRGLIPDEVIDRPKVGFGAPVREWLAGPFGAFAKNRLLGDRTGLFNGEVVRRLWDEHVSGRVNRSLHLWVLLNLVLWHDHWIAGDF
jgi:asparagine synthase (glutamine-hydrolysing)